MGQNGKRYRVSWTICQPNFDHFVFLPLHALGEVLKGVEFFIPEYMLQFSEQEPITGVQVWTVGALFDWVHLPLGQILLGIGGSMGLWSAWAEPRSKPAWVCT